MNNLNSEAQKNAHYLYCVAENPDGRELFTALVGIEGESAYPIVYRDIVIVAHNTLPQIVAPEDEQRVLAAVLCHEKVIEEVGSRYASTLPFAFNTIVKGLEGESAKASLIKWLSDNYDSLQTKLARVRDKKEYIVTIALDCRVIGSELVVTDAELKEFQETIAASSRGRAFFIREKMQAVLKDKIAGYADELFHEIYPQLTALVSEHRVEKAKPESKDQVVLMKVACLADNAQVDGLGAALDKLMQRPGINVTFSGPWPPYSFT
ncbi:MAG: GvpL/GvpF family gas vesicle protein [Bacillota bacterium]